MRQTTVTVASWKRYRAATSAPALPQPTMARGHGGFNQVGADDRQAVYETSDLPQVYCQWLGMRLPTEAE